MSDCLDEMRRRKKQLRREAKGWRRALLNRDELSRRIAARVMALPEYAEASTVLLYVSVGDEVRTGDLIRRCMEAGRRAVIPYCLPDELELFLLRNLDELTPGMLDILEPRPELRADPRRRVPIEEVDLVLVPGLAFDRRGGRLGHGKAYYDKLLGGKAESTRTVGLAFECQLVDEVPMAPHDVFLDRIVTEEDVYPS